MSARSARDDNQPDIAEVMTVGTALVGLQAQARPPKQCLKESGGGCGSVSSVS